MAALSLASRVSIAGPDASRVAGLSRKASVRNQRLSSGLTVRAMANITPNVSFDTIAREWRCKWDAANDKASLVAAQEVLDSVTGDLKAIPGVKSVQRVVCGGCLDFKIVTAVDADKFGDWESKDFAPESDVLAKLEGIDGVKLVETQTYTLMDV